MSRVFSRRWFIAGAMAVGSGVGCRASQILTVPPPSGVVTYGNINGDSAAEAAFYTARTDLFAALAGGNSNLIEDGGLLTDEFSYAFFFFAKLDGANVDARRTAAEGGYAEVGDLVLQHMLAARSELLVSMVNLTKYETGSARARIGESYALIGYSELFMAEDYCAGVPLSQLVAGGGAVYGSPLTTDSLLGVAQAHFDSAAAYASGNDTIATLASVGIARTLMDRGQYAAAAAKVANVPTAFTYDITGETDGQNAYFATLYEAAISGTYDGRCNIFNVADGEGTNGLPFVSAGDPRLTLDPTLAQTCDGVYARYFGAVPDSILNYPLKFGNPSSDVPLATGIEARLIAAEAALATNPSDPTWLTDLNTLRTSGCRNGADSSCGYGAAQVPAQPWGLHPLADPGTDTGRVSLLFRERAFWLFGTGIRLGDLRRLIRQYDRPNEEAFPTGTYLLGTNPTFSRYLPSPLSTYGTDVSLTLPTKQSGYSTGNPNYKGCLSSTQVA